MSMRRSFLIDVAAVAALVADVAAIRTPRFAAVREPIVARRRAAHRPANLHPRAGAEHRVRRP
jgi:hypothetical protein